MTSVFQKKSILAKVPLQSFLTDSSSKYKLMEVSQFSISFYNLSSVSASSLMKILPKLVLFHPFTLFLISSNLWATLYIMEPWIGEDQHCKMMFLKSCWVVQAISNLKGEAWGGLIGCQLKRGLWFNVVLGKEVRVEVWPRSQEEEVRNLSSLTWISWVPFLLLDQVKGGPLSSISKRPLEARKWARSLMLSE